jgi:hypothetical protein
MPRKYYLCLISLSIVICSFAQPRPITVEQYINRYKYLAISEMKQYMIPASITLAQAIHESSNGNSTLAKEANNHFGIKCQDNWRGETFIKDDDKKDECFRKYKCVEESFHDHSDFIKNRSRYAFLFQYKSNDYVSWAKGLKTAGYATNPRYPEILISTIEKYKLNELDMDSSVLLPDNQMSQLNKKSNTECRKLNLRYRIHRELIIKNNIEAIIAKNGDNYEDLAREMDMFPRQILRYNDLKITDVIKDGEIIYLQPKKRNAKTDFHIIKSGESYRDISQEYGIKLKCLLRKNKLEAE